MEQQEENEINEEVDVEDDTDNYNDWESDGDADDAPVKSLFCDVLLPSVQAQLDFDRQTFDFDLKNIITEMNLQDDLLLIMLVNYIRHVSKSASSSTGTVDVKALSDSIRNREFITDTDAYMKPVLEDDPLLYGLRDALGEGFDRDDYEDDDEEQHDDIDTGGASNIASTSGKERTIEQLQELFLRYKALHDALGSSTDEESDINQMTEQDILSKIDEYKLKLKDI